MFKIVSLGWYKVATAYYQCLLSQYDKAQKTCFNKISRLKLTIKTLERRVRETTEDNEFQSVDSKSKIIQIEATIAKGALVNEEDKYNYLSEKIMSLNRMLIQYHAKIASCRKREA